MPERAYEITTALDGYREGRVVFAESAGKARYQSVLNAWDAGYDGFSFRHVRVKALGPRKTPLEIATERAEEFNSAFPPGTPVRVYPFGMGNHKTAYNTEVEKPGAYLGQHYNPCIWVKVPGDSILITHVVPLAAPKKESGHA